VTDQTWTFGWGRDVPREGAEYRRYEDGDTFTTPKHHPLACEAVQWRMAPAPTVAVTLTVADAHWWGGCQPEPSLRGRLGAACREALTAEENP
jgi:hypothetical protein